MPGKNPNQNGKTAEESLGFITSGGRATYYGPKNSDPPDHGNRIGYVNQVTGDEGVTGRGNRCAFIEARIRSRPDALNAEEEQDQRPKDPDCDFYQWDSDGSSETKIHQQ